MENQKTKITISQMAKTIDHTLLKPEASRSDFEKLCDEAIQYGFKSVCVNSCWVAYVGKRLKDTEVDVCCVIGFPLGAMDSEAKAFEAEKAIKDGATELDMVINLGMLKSGELKAVEDDIQIVRQKANEPIVLKVIIETCLLTEEEKVQACKIAKKAGADFVKTSTGFSSGGATQEDISLMRKIVGPEIGVKASGGIKTFSDAATMIQAGANRIGAGAGVDILKSEGGIE